MLFEWDEEKNNACLRKRGFNFGFAARIFFDPERVVELDNRRSYGEDRYRVTGRIDGRLYLVVYTPRLSTLRIISARKANKREVDQHENSASSN
jgi:hypothetical protein